MLILTRRIGEKIMLGDDICLVILSVRGGQVRIGVDAPRNITVHRDEVYQRIKKEEERALLYSKPKTAVKKIAALEL